MSAREIVDELKKAPYELCTPFGGVAPMPDLETAVYVAQRLLELHLEAEWVEIRDNVNERRVGRLYKNHPRRT